MVIGSGMMAGAFTSSLGDAPSICVYAAGVSNSGSSDHREFERELIRLRAAVEQYRTAKLFLYFGTCSVNDPVVRLSPYVQHKLKMEQLVMTHPGHLIVRLPQVAGPTSNPHTLLNYIFARISRGERFQVWKNAQRNIIDIDDVVRIIVDLALVEGARGERINVANFSNIDMPDLVEIMERVIGKKALCDYVEKGAPYMIDTRRINAITKRCGISFDPQYTEQVFMKYYGKAISA
ncbi:MAG: NAD-dependent epimerase/dehydratase family protein [Thermodesulfovibrionales bacterium]